MQINIKVESSDLMPIRAHANDAGADLKSNQSLIINPHEQAMVDTGVAIAIPSGYVGLVFNRSSQGKLGISIPNSVGVIDSDYRGNIKVLLRNDTEFYSYSIEAGVTRVAQLVIVPIVLAEFNDVENLDETTRGTGGFGSTGQ